MEKGSNMPTEYVEKQQNVYRITDTRVSLDSIVYAWWAGQSEDRNSKSLFRPVAPAAHLRRRPPLAGGNGCGPSALR